MAQTIAEMMVTIGADPSEFQNTSKTVEKEMKSMGTTVSSMAKSMGTNVQGFSDKWKAMSNEMKASYKQSQAALMPFKQDLMGVEYDFFKLSKSMKDYQGTNQQFMDEVATIGKRHKKATEAMIINNDMMKKSFIQTVGTMVNRSGQSEKIAANFSRMGNPLYTVNNGLLKIGSNLERVARNGNASVLALKMLGPNANMKQLQDMTMMINRGLMRFIGVAAISTIAVALFYGALHDAAKSIPGYTEAFDTMGSTMRNAFQPMVEIFAAIMTKVYEFITLIGNLMNKFNEMNPVLAGMVQSFLMLLPVLFLILSPLAIGIGMFGGLQAAISGLWLIIGPFVTGFLTIAGTAMIIAAALVAVGAALYLLWTKTDWFKAAVLKIWDAIKSGTKAAWDWLMNNVITPVMTAIMNFVKEKLEFIRKFWDENGKMIMQAAKNVWNVIYKGIIQPVMIAIGAIMSVMWPVIKALIIGTWEAIKQTINGAINVILGIIKFFSALFTGNWSALWDATKQILIGAANLLIGFLQLSFFGGIIRGIKGLAISAKTLFSGLWDDAVRLFTNGATKVKGVVSKGFNAVLDFIKSLGSKFFDAGKGLIDMMAKGIKNAAGAVLKAVKGLAQKARDFLPFSPAKEGPLSDLDKLDFGGPIADSLDKAIPKVKGLMGDLMTLPSVNISGGTNDQQASKNNNFTQNLHFHGDKPLTPSETAKKNLQASRKLAMEWGIS
jgi:phage-related protein